MQDRTESAKSEGAIPTTEKLDLRGVNFAVSAESQFRDRFYSRATKQLEELGPLWTESEPKTKPSAALRLDLNPESLDELCPGMVWYAPSLALIEDVMVDRSGQLIPNSTWSSKQAAAIRKPPTIEEIEKDLDGFIHRFVTNYKLGNPGMSPEGRPRQRDGVPGNDSYSGTMSTVPPVELQTNATLKALKLNDMKFSLWAGGSSKSLYARGVALASKEGIALSSRFGKEPTTMLHLRLESRPLGSVCRGNYLYEASIELVEQVRIKRNPRIYIWTETWSQHKRHIGNDVSRKQLERDVDELLGQFLVSYKADNQPATPN